MIIDLDDEFFDECPLCQALRDNGLDWDMVVGEGKKDADEYCRILPCYLQRICNKLKIQSISSQLDEYEKHFQPIF